MSLRSILGGRVKKKKATSTLSSPSPNHPPKSSSSAPSPQQSWTSSLPRRKPGITSNSRKDYEEDWFGDKLDDHGLVEALATDLSLRDTPQAIRYIGARMFAPLPETATGMTSTRIAEVLNFRRNLPPIVSVSHIQALLSSPSAVEREIAELARQGFLRRVVVPRRGAVGDFVVLSSDYEASVRKSGVCAGEAFLRFLAANPDCQTLVPDSLAAADMQALVHAGFLTVHHTGGIFSYDVMSANTEAYSRPEDKITLTSVETVSRHATGTLGTVGGDGAVHNAGGSGGGPLLSAAALPVQVTTTEYRLAVPGCGSFLKLVSAAVDHLVALLGKTRFGEAPGYLLRERWDGGIVKEAKRARREYGGVLPGQTRKWRQFYGLSFDWVLQEAVGAGLVEIFETQSVGRGVRATR
ncbi:serine-threonine protein kinase 19-domain-containing protein [Poronia punctata]|nr:serine-threonine protein kinase 19-domain-containing protein [Poronia punctata]